MRVIAGIFRSRPLTAPPGTSTRPTSDRLRETLFNVLTHGAVDRVANANFLDLYAGSGTVGIEAISRGAAHVTFVDQDAGALAALKGNLASLGIQKKCLVEKKSVARFLADSSRAGNQRPGVIFLDPPYDSAEEYESTLNTLGVQAIEGGLVIAEHRRKIPLMERYSDLQRFRVLEQGDAALSFYRFLKAGEV